MRAARGMALAAAVALGALSLAPSVARAADALAELERQQTQLFEKVGPSVVFISTADGFGSGFFVEPGLVLTNAHVVRDVRTATVVIADGRKVEGRVAEKAAEDIDLALVRVPVTDVEPLPLDEGRELRVGSWVGSVGHGRGGIWSFVTGMVSNIYPAGSQRSIFQTQIPLNPGSSGGPIIDRRGRVVGVVTAAMKESNSMNFAIRADVALRVLSLLGAKCACVTVTAPPDVNVFVDGALVGKGPRVVFPAEARTYEVSALVRGVMKRVTVRYPAERTVTLTN
jgi:S1-C subfamily serine protease